MRKSLTIGLAVLISLAAVGAVVLAFDAHKKAYETKQRQVVYQRTLNEYEARFPIGTSRREVEGTLLADSVQFSQSCCETSSYKTTDSIEIGREPGSWYCSYWSEAIEFDFDGPSDSSTKDPSDRLSGVRLRMRSGPCL